eukprot:7164260-Prymnesium_polylepis.1
MACSLDSSSQYHAGQVRWHGRGGKSGLPTMFARDCPTVCPRLAVPCDDGAYMRCGRAAVVLRSRS